MTRAEKTLANRTNRGRCDVLGVQHLRERRREHRGDRRSLPTEVRLQPFGVEIAIADLLADGSHDDGREHTHENRKRPLPQPGRISERSEDTRVPTLECRRQDVSPALGKLLVRRWIFESVDRGLSALIVVAPRPNVAQQLRCATFGAGSLHDACKNDRHSDRGRPCCRGRRLANHHGQTTDHAGRQLLTDELDDVVGHGALLHRPTRPHCRCGRFFAASWTVDMRMVRTWPHVRWVPTRPFPQVVTFAR